MLELYPFGRKAFRFELDPVLGVFVTGLWGPAGLSAVSEMCWWKKRTRNHMRNA